MEAPDGQGLGVPWTARAISARACRVRRSFAARASSCVARNPTRPPRRRPLKTTGERFPLDHPKKPSGRRPDAPPVLSGASRI